MRYKCTMCGTIVEADKPCDECIACGSPAEYFQAIPFDAKCPHCAHGYYLADHRETCPNCARSLKAAKEKGTAKPRRNLPPRRKAPAATKATKGAKPAAKKEGGCLLKTFLVLFAIFMTWLFCKIVAWLVAFAWNLFGFLANHWLSVLITLTVMGAAFSLPKVK